LVFTGNQEGYVKAFDDTNGKVLWQFQTGASVRGQPASYKINGRQYIAVPSGGGGIMATLIGEPPLAGKGSALIVFALP
jgi:alcohol dehydrogenase (cytochrome c)